MIVGFTTRIDGYVFGNERFTKVKLMESGFDLSRPYEREIDYETGLVTYTQEAKISLKEFV